MRLTLATLRGGVVWDEAPPPETEAAIGRHLPPGQLVATFSGKAANAVADEILHELLDLPPSPKLMTLLANLQIVARREQSKIIILQ